MLAMPIAILISSIMTFGNLGESFELVAIKSAGISLLRFMRPLMMLTILLCGITFIFANYVIPYANLKFITLYSDIYVKKPAFDLKEGVFYTHIPNYAIKVGKKEADGKTIKNIVIFEQSNSLQDNCIVAQSGVMQLSPDQQYLEFNLENGFRYQEKGNYNEAETEFTRIGFTSFKKLFDLSVLQKQQTNDSLFRTNFKMLSAGKLLHNIDSLQKLMVFQNQRMNIDFKRVMRYVNLSDSFISANKTGLTKIKYTELIPDSMKYRVKQSALNKVSELKNIVQQKKLDDESRERDLRYHKMEWHRKFSISLACLVLFFIGAPLGAIIRKGGLGMPLVVAIVFFLIFHLLNMFGDKFSKEGILEPAVGMWLAIISLTPVGIFLTYKAMNDSALFNKEFYVRFWKKFKTIASTSK
jgi:lipopolysaccharide export system permease protein